jgi:hypothetical protein
MRLMTSCFGTSDMTVMGVLLCVAVGVEGAGRRSTSWANLGAFRPDLGVCRTVVCPGFAVVPDTIGGAGGDFAPASGDETVSGSGVSRSLLEFQT